ncbi:TPA: hypothetical protein ACFM7A_001739 [Neisseria meningitidis]|nr:hypothetical protein [Neisseria meningitidis]MCL5823682.1 hypothetical protein [Neisseria meningitidis]
MKYTIFIAQDSKLPRHSRPTRAVQAFFKDIDGFLGNHFVSLAVDNPYGRTCHPVPAQLGIDIVFERYRITGEVYMIKYLIYRKIFT